MIDASELRLQPAGKQDNDQQPTVRRSGVHWETIRDIWSTVLNMPAHTIPMDQPFLSLGGTSIKAVQVLGALETELGLSLTNDIIIKCHTVNQLDEYLTALTGRAGATRHDRTETPRASSAADIAVIETACRFPDAATPEEFWTNLVDGRCSIGNIPSDRWNVPTDNACCQAGAFIADPYAFDPGFFKIPEGEAAVMDPQQRLILQLFFELLERAGYTKKDVDGKRVAIFIGASGNTYYELRLHSLAGQALQELASFAALAAKDRQAILAEWEGRFGSPGNHPNMAVGNIMNMIAARVAHEFNLHGPNMVIDTACSSSLVAIHLACESLRKGECEMAVAGGVNLILTPSPYLLLSGAGVLSASGRAKVFDASADGFVPGEGAGLVLLKPLERAMADGDRVLAVVKGSAVNNDGHALGVMSPNPDGQKEVIEQVYTKTGIDPGTIQYVEAHATGTAIGDPIEIRALSNAFSRWTPARQSIAVGSVKTNIGHLIGSAGVASFIKMILSFTNGKLPPLINLNTPNPAIKFEQTPFYPLTKAKAWPVQPGAPRRAAIDSFGFGGTNCHMLLEEAPAGETLDATDKPLLPRHVLCLSAHSPAAFVRKAHDLADYLERRDDFQLGDACFSENLRTPLVYRTHAVASSPRELMFRLREAVPTKAKPSPKVGFMFTGQGSQYVGMGRALYDSLPSFKDILDACSGLFSPFLQTKITDLIYSEDADERTIGPASLAQAVTFALDYALGKYLIQIGIKPSFLIGHGTGEWVAASLAGAMELPVAVRLVAATGKLMGDLSSSNGGMAAVFADVNTIEQLLAQFGGSLRIAAYNLSHLVVSGTMEDITGFLGILRGKGIMGKKLSPAHGSHTPLVEPMLENFRREMDGIDFRLPQIPFVSTVGGGILNQPPDADHWSLHSTAPVRFEEGINYMRNKGVDVFLEVGPDKILGDMLNSLPDRERIRVFSTCSRHSDGLEVFLDTLGKLFTTGVNIDWRAFEKDFGHERALLPAYPFAHKRYTLFDRQEARQH
ncbi:MAG: beta-ketoacyl synthase N-terminal-like domain-containing protein [Peptococcaceae bacterium]|nr:beta-ketoacyl synthase N-terminal-like domain-containing protein [Peptococcaceae bacterium]